MARSPGAEKLHAGEIHRRSIVGAKWLVLTTLLGTPAAFLAAFLLGRTGPSALGAYGLAQILVGITTTFVVYGGPPVFAVFLPKLADDPRRGPFVCSYFLIVVVAMIATLSLFVAWPNGFEFLLQRDFDTSSYAWFAVLAVAVAASDTLTNLAAGLMLIKVTAIARQMVRAVLVLVVAVLYVFDRGLLVERGLQCMVVCFVAGSLAAATVAILGIARDRRLAVRPGWYLPPGFWAFSTTMMAATVLTFLYNNIDRLAVLGGGAVEGLGMYQAVLSLTSLITFVPQVLETSLVPMFASLIATEDMSAVSRAYNGFQRGGSIMITGGSLVLVAYSRELLLLFGARYTAFANLLAIFAVQGVVTSPRFANTPIITALERNGFKLAVSCGQVALQAAGTFAFVGRFGVPGIVGAKVVAVVCAQLAVTAFVILRLKMGFVLPRTYMVGIVVAAGAAAVRHALPQSWSVSTLVFLGATLIFFGLGGVTLGELKQVLKWIFKKRQSP